MAILGAAGVAHTVKIYKAHSLNSYIEWSNTYEIVSDTEQTLASAITAMQDLVKFERAFHTGYAVFKRAIISTWTPDSKPYNPNSFVSVPLQQGGSRDIVNAELAPLHMCLKVSFQVNTGRQGYRLYRGCLTEGDFNSPAGLPVLINGSTPSSMVIGSQVNLTGLFGGGASPWTLVLHSATHTRDVVMVAPAGITMKKFNNRYFDRTGGANQ